MDSMTNVDRLRWLTLSLSGGGRTTTGLRLGHCAAHHRCSPVRCSGWFGGGYAAESLLTLS